MTILRNLIRLLREPGFAGVCVVTLGLGLGAVITIFTLVDGVVLRQLPYPDSQQLVSIDHRAPNLGLPHMGISPALYLQYRDHAESFEEIALVNDTQVTLAGDGTPERVPAANVTPSFFRAIGLAPIIGRALSEQDGALGAPDVAVLSEGLWRERYGAERTIIGQKILVKGVPHEVIGVMPRALALPTPETRLWLARQVDEANAQLGSFGDFAVARLRPGLDVVEARAELDRFTTNIAELFPEDGASGVLQQAEFFAHVEPLLDTMVGDVRAVLWILLGTVSLILLIACANVTNLFLVRVEERGNEIAVRSALGASRQAVLRGLLAETMAVALLAGVLAVVLAWAAVIAIQSFGPGDIPRLEELTIGLRVLGFSVLVSLFAGLFLGALPALRGSRPDLVAALKEGGRSATTGRERHRLRGGLVIAQVALGMVLLTGCGLLVRSLLELRAVDPGFRTEGALTFQLSLAGVKYPDPVNRARFAEQLQERLGALPGVTMVGVGEYLPLSDQNSGSGYTIEEFPLADDDLPPVFSTVEVGAGYFEAMGMRLLEGRFLDATDIRSRNGAVVVTRGLAEQYWAGGSALGKRIQPGQVTEDGWSEIVGVIADVRNEGLDKEPNPTVFRPLLGPEGGGQDIDLSMAFVLATDRDPSTLASAVRSEVWSVDPDVPITQLQTLSQLVESSRATMNFTVVVLLLASLMALVIAAVGLYGVVSYLVSQRRHEFGIRMALGADRRSVSRMVLREGLVVAILGTALGLVLSFFATRLLDTVLFGVERVDPLTFAAVPLVLLLVTLLASWIPALRASRLDPLIALRHE